MSPPGGSVRYSGLYGVLCRLLYCGQSELYVEELVKVDSSVVCTVHRVYRTVVLYMACVLYRSVCAVPHHVYCTVPCVLY